MRDNKTLNKKWSKCKNPAFLTANARQVFIQFRQTFTKSLIYNYFDPKQYI